MSELLLHLDGFFSLFFRFNTIIDSNIWFHAFKYTENYWKALAGFRVDKFMKRESRTQFANLIVTLDTIVSLLEVRLFICGSF